MSNEKIKVLYIAGSGRSGSTLLERVIGQSDNFVSIGELRHIWLRNPELGDLCGCGKLLISCDFWREVFNVAFGGIDNIDFHHFLELRMGVDRVRYIPFILFPHLAPKTFRDSLSIYTDIMKSLYSAIYKVSSGKIIIDSSKDLSSLVLTSKYSNIELKVLQLIRDSRGVAYSWSKRRKIRPEITKEVTYLAIHNPTRMAIDWTIRNLVIEIYKENTENFAILRYEDFISDPKKYLMKIFSDLDIAQDNLDFINREQVSISRINHTIAGNPMRFQNGEISLSLDTEWTRKMPWIDKSLVTFFTWPLLNRYGYKILS